MESIEWLNLVHDYVSVSLLTCSQSFLLQILLEVLSSILDQKSTHFVAQFFEYEPQKYIRVLREPCRVTRLQTCSPEFALSWRSQTSFQVMSARLSQFLLRWTIISLSTYLSMKFFFFFFFFFHCVCDLGAREDDCVFFTSWLSSWRKLQEFPFDHCPLALHSYYFPTFLSALTLFLNVNLLKNTWLKSLERQ